MSYGKMPAGNAGVHPDESRSCPGERIGVKLRSMVLSKAGLSRLLAEVLPQDGDIDAFVAQSFGNLVRRVGRGADRIAKIALLVDNVDPKALLEKISSARPREVARSEFLLVEGKHVAGAPIPDTGPCVGRDAQLADVSALVFRDKAEPVLLLGPAGVGKTTIALATLHAAAAVQRFGGRRYLARLDRAPGTDAAIVEIARALDVVPEAPLRQQVVEALRRAPALLVLDDIDVPMERDPSNLADLIAELASVSSVSLIASSRTEERASDVLKVVAVGSLSDSAARDAFCAFAGEGRRADTSLSFVSTEAKGNPLALRALAFAAGDGPLDVALRSWHQQQNELLMRPEGPEQASPVEIAVALSMLSLTDGGRRVAALASALPNGILAEDLVAILPSGAEGAEMLAKGGLVTDAGGRFRLRRAVREHVAPLLPSVGEEFVRATYHYASISLANGPKIGWPDSEDSSRRLAQDSDNIEEMILGGFEGPHRIAAIDAAGALATFIGSSGHCTPRIVQKARDAARDGGDKLGEADCTQALGDIALARGDIEEARVRYVEALPLFHQARAGLSIASCLVRIGDIALERHDLDEATRRYTEAVPFYHHIKDKLGEASALRNLGEIAMARDDHEEARARYKEALPLFNELGEKAASALCLKGMADISFQRNEYPDARALYEEVGPLLQELGDKVGMAQCLQNLGDIAFANGEHQAAEAHYQKALPIIKESGDKLAEATCLSTLGDVALACTEIEDAQAYYLAALPLLRQVGEKHGEANCIQSLGDIALTQFEHDNARTQYETALALFVGLHDDYSIGWTHYRLAQVAADPEIFRTHLVAARDAWLRIDRHDLIADVNTEFPGIL